MAPVVSQVWTTWLVVFSDSFVHLTLVSHEGPCSGWSWFTDRRTSQVVGVHWAATTPHWSGGPSLPGTCALEGTSSGGQKRSSIGLWASLRVAREELASVPRKHLTPALCADSTV